MKSVTQSFIDALNKPYIAVKRIVSYKRRYWNASTSAYIWETNWTTVTEDKVVSVSPITSQLDTQTQNAFRVSSVTVVLKNFDHEWSPQNSIGKFAKDSVSSLGYEPFWTKIRIQAGLLYTNGTSELVTLFTGVVGDLNFNTQQDTVQFMVNGEQDLLVRTNAENVSTTVTSENIGTGNGSTTVFTTSHNGVGIVRSVSVAGVAKRAGVDYTISQLNDQNNPAKITFPVAPASGAITATYIYWQTLQKFETLVTNLLNQANIPGGNQQVSPVVFATSIVNTHIWQTQADWQGGSSLSYIDTTKIVNSITGDDGTTELWYGSTSGWTSGGTHGSFANVSGNDVIRGDATGNNCSIFAYHANSGAVGTWILSYTFDSSQWSGGTGLFTWCFFINNLNSGGTADTFEDKGYNIQFGNTPVNGRIYLVRNDAGAVSTILGSFLPSTNNLSGLNGTHTIKVNRTAAGVFTVYYDGVLKITATDTNYSTCAYIGASVNSFGTNTNNPILTLNGTGSQIPQSPTGVASWISNTVDFGATPSSWTQFLYTQILNSGTATYYTRASPDGSTWDSWVAISGNVINSTLRRYIQARVDFDMTNGNPSVSNIQVGSNTSSTVVTLANFTGMTVYDAITQLASLANYEFGFDGSENFFFRPKKTTASPVMTLDSTTFLVEVLSMTGGYDAVYNAVRAAYGSYTSEVDDPGNQAFQPTPRFGQVLYQPSVSTILVTADADLASNIAQSAFNYYSKPRRKIKVQTKFLPQLDLSDVISVSFSDLTFGLWYWGDTDVYWGNTNYFYYGSDEFALAPLTTKVVGFRMDTDNWNCEFDLEEVVT